MTYDTGIWRVRNWFIIIIIIPGFLGKIKNSRRFPGVVDSLFYEVTPVWGETDINEYLGMTAVASRILNSF